MCCVVFMVCVLASVCEHGCIGACLYMHVDARKLVQVFLFLFCFQSFSNLSLLVKGLGFFEEINDPTYETLKVKDVCKAPITT